MWQEEQFGVMSQEIKPSAILGRNFLLDLPKNRYEPFGGQKYALLAVSIRVHKGQFSSGFGVQQASSSSACDVGNITSRNCFKSNIARMGPFQII